MTRDYAATVADPPRQRAPAVMTPRPGCLLLGIPVLAIVAVFLAYVWLIFTGLAGREAAGERVEIHFEACTEAIDVVERRVAEMGLGDPDLTRQPGGFRLVATLPDDEGVAHSIPTTLSTPGFLTVHGLDADLGTPPVLDHTGVSSSSVRLDLTMSPTTLVQLERDAILALRSYQKADPGGRFEIRIDGEKVAEWSNQKSLGPGELEIPPDAANDQARMELAAARGIMSRRYRGVLLGGSSSTCKDHGGRGVPGATRTGPREIPPRHH